MIRHLALACALQLAAAAAGAAGCTAASGTHTAALVELYTSEGCSSCPPADRRFGELVRAHAPGRVVPLALHVPYWDDLGWKDAFAQPDFALRQSRLVALNGGRSVYTPHFFVAGRELRDWREGLDAAIGRVNAQPAAVRLAVGAAPARPGMLAVEAEVAGAAEGSALFVAVTEDGLSSDVRAGENRGATLRHDRVVRVLLGPLATSAGTIRREVPVGPGWQAARLGVAAFVQDPRGAVIQAVATGPCGL